MSMLLLRGGACVIRKPLENDSKIQNLLKFALTTTDACDNTKNCQIDNMCQNSLELSSPSSYL